MKNLNVILLVGGQSTRFTSSFDKKIRVPKALGKIDSNELIIHVMNHLNKHNLKNFILPLGYFKKEFIFFFLNKKKIFGKKCNIFLKYDEYLKHVALNNNHINILLQDTGLNSNKAQRVYAIVNKLNLENFVVTYGDAVGNINLKKMYHKHLKSSCFMSAAAIQPYSQYGHFSFNNSNNVANNFIEKPKLNHWINIGYFFFKKPAIEFLKKYRINDLESGIVKKISKKNKLFIYKHTKFWKSVDTLKDLIELKKNVKKLN
tara:strand:- start:43 stop:822 length:780 start_codon:yes stop_codon:yes gene_type:complete